MSFTTTGVTPDQIGPVYDLAMGRIDSTGNAEMVGYVLTPSSGWTEATNLQDEEHLVQVDSPFSTDRFGRYPKVSQGDWSGGERQLIFVNGNQYYQSQQLQTMVPGHLTCAGYYTSFTITNGITGAGTTQQPRSVSQGSSEVFVIGGVGGTYAVTKVNLNTGVQTVYDTNSNSPPNEMLRLGNGLYVAQANGIWQLNVTSGAWTQVVDDDVEGVLQGSSLSYLEGQIYYLLGGSTGGSIYEAGYPFPGASAGTQVYAGYEFESNLQAVTNSGTGLVVVAQSAAGFQAWVYSFDGASANYLGMIEGAVQDVCQANGVVYILCETPYFGGQVTSPAVPIIYQLDGSTLSVFDDFRAVSSDFLPIAAKGYGHLAQDGRYLYLFTSGLNTKRYNLTSGAISDIGNPSADSGLEYQRAGAALIDGSIAEIDMGLAGSNTLYACLAQAKPNANGYLITSWYDFGTPGVDKSFTQIEFTFNAPTDATSLNAVTLQFQVNNPTATWTSVTGALAQNSNDVIFTLPYPTIGSRVRFQITLVAAEAPDIQSYSISATLARTWTVTVSCRRNQSVRNGAPGRDPQNLTSTQLIANIKECYRSGGNVVLYMPDPTIDEAAVAANLGPAVGVALCFAVLQDYSWTTANTGVSPAYRTDATPPGIEGDAVLTLTEALG
jgi:hypothetical protein